MAEDVKAANYGHISDLVGFALQIKKLVEAFRDEVEDHQHFYPVLGTQPPLLEFFHQSLVGLRLLIEDPKQPEFSWNRPLCQLLLPAKCAWEKLQSIEFDPNRIGVLPQEAVTAMDPSTGRFIADFLIRRASFYRTQSGEMILMPKEDAERINALPKSKRAVEMKKLRQPYTRTSTIELPQELSPGKKTPARLSFFMQVNGLSLDAVKKRAMYSYIAGIALQGTRPAQWSEETKRIFWETILGELERVIPFPRITEGAADMMLASSIAPYSKLIRAGLHTELQKIGHKPEPHQPTFWDMLPERESVDARDYHIEAIGIDNTIAQNKALHAVQVLLDQTKYQGNLPPMTHLDPRKKENPFHFSGTLPLLKCTPAEYFDAYGVNSRQTNRGKKEYNANERAEALQALRDLHDKRYLFHYERKYWVENERTKKREERFDVIRTVRPLITITEGYEALSRMERDDITSGGASESGESKLKYFIIEPAPPLVDQIDKYFVLKDANYKQEIKLLFPHASKYVYNFIDYLIAQGELIRRNNGPWMIKIDIEDLAWKLRMNSWITSRNWKQVRTSLSKCYEAAKRLGYLLDAKTVQGKTKAYEELTLNRQKLDRARSIAEPAA